MISALQKILESEDFPEGSAWCRRTFAVQEVIVREGEQDGHLCLVVTDDLRVTGQVKSTTRAGGIRASVISGWGTR